MSAKRIHLLSCTSCKRQLDVTALEVGDEVQCVCDAVLVVGPPREVTVGGLACGHCGGVVSETDTTCSYCNAELSREDRKETTICPVCAARLPNDSQHCKACGVELRAAAVPAIPHGAKCPRCDGGLRVHLLEDGEVIECKDEGGCGGMWVSRDAFERMQRSARHAAATGASDAPEAPHVRSLGAPEGAVRQYVPCLVCGELMQRRQFRHGHRAAGIVLDVCRDHGVWFDRDELENALAFVRSEVRQGSGLDPVRPENSATAPARHTSVKIFDAKDSRYRRRFAGGGLLEDLIGSLLESIWR
ncbi:MAG: zinc ribbon domain-containing protein [Planctomycetota bacterium]